MRSVSRRVKNYPPYLYFTIVRFERLGSRILELAITVDVDDYCARAASGHATAAPARVMKSRRLNCRRSANRGPRRVGIKPTRWIDSTLPRSLLANGCRYLPLLKNDRCFTASVRGGETLAFGWASQLEIDSMTRHSATRPPLQHAKMC